MDSKDWKDSFSIDIPSVEDVAEMYNPPPASFHSPGTKGKETYALATASYGGLIPEVMTAYSTMLAQAAWDVGPGNLWVLPVMPRLPYPFAPLYSLASMFKTERAAGRKCDWLIWYDDDVRLPKNLFRGLREAADPKERPFVAAVGVDRFPPFRVAVWQPVKYGEVESRKQWVCGEPWRHDQMTMPATGVHQVDTTGLCAAIFHRSFFDRVPQPWFAAIPARVEPDGDIGGRANPDAWLCQQCKDNDMPVHVTCDVKITHMGLKIPVNCDNAEQLRQVFRGPNETR